MNENITKTGGAERSATGRYLIAAGCALVGNIALMILLSSNAHRDRAGLHRPPQAFPLEVIDVNVSENRPVLTELIEPAPKTPRPPELPLPVLSVQVPNIPQPVRLELAIEATSHIAPNTQDIVVPQAYEVPVPVAVSVPRPIPVSKPAAPKPVGASRGPLRIDPPNLSDYYPRAALRKGITGVTTVKLVIDSTGRVESITILTSTPVGVFENAARRHAQASRFQPAMRNGKPVSSVVRYNIKWRLPAGSRR